jgi:4-hydroxy-3-methylbut-2-enyl diphosphate reductase
VWKKSQQIGKTEHTIIIHGKHNHEETRSTFSRSALDSQAVVIVRDLEEAKKLGEYILGNKSQEEFEAEFKGKFTPGLQINKHFSKLGVINQTTMLATETAQIAQYFKDTLIQKYGEAVIKEHFSDTNDTLCYATNENQDATYGLLDTDADLAIVVGGYNSSNTSHLVELCERRFPTYFISSEKEIESRDLIHHFNYPEKKRVTTQHFLPDKKNLRIVITSGASCPDSLLDAIIHRLNGLIGNTMQTDQVMDQLSTFSAN